MKKNTCKYCLTVALAAIILSSCGGTSEQTASTDAPVSEDITSSQTQAVQEETVAETEAETQGEIQTSYYTNPLTGELTSLNDVLFMRPVAVVLKNDRTGAPQLGIKNADIVYEAAVEGGMTRLLALFSDYSQTGDIGPIIDSRTYFYNFAAFHDAIFVQAGTTAEGKKVQSATNTDCLDAIAGMAEPTFRRDEQLAQDRDGLSNILTTGQGLKDRITSQSIRETNKNTTTLTLNFTPYGSKNTLLDVGRTCIGVKVPYSASMAPYFLYSTITDTYTRYQYGEKHLDADGTELKYTNIIILSVDYSVINDSSGELGADLTSSGKGYYATAGKYIPITWKYDEEKGTLTYHYETGESLDLNRGKTFVCAVPDTRINDVQFEK